MTQKSIQHIIKENLLLLKDLVELKSKIYTHMTAVSKNVYFVFVLNDIVDKYNNTFQIIIKMKPADVKSDAYLQYNKDSNEKDPKFKVLKLICLDMQQKLILNI